MSDMLDELARSRERVRPHRVALTWATCSAGIVRTSTDSTTATSAAPVRMLRSAGSATACLGPGAITAVSGSATSRAGVDAATRPRRSAATTGRRTTGGITAATRTPSAAAPVAARVARIAARTWRLSSLWGLCVVQTAGPAARATAAHLGCSALPKRAQSSPTETGESRVMCVASRTRR
jgi:hypothetical protein